MVFVVAEIGVNWDGNFDLAKSMMKNAKNCGCSAVKFQSFNDSIVKDHPEKFRLLNSSISEKNVELINDLAESVGIEWFSTPMYPQAVEILEPYVSKFKVREFDGRPLLEGRTTELIERILKTNKEMIVSSQQSPKNVTILPSDKTKWLYVVPKYPCSLSDLDFRNLDDFDGFSNHCPDVIAPVAASILGAEIIEVHVTSDKMKPFIDNNVSFDFKELSELIRLIKLAAEIRK